MLFLQATQALKEDNMIRKINALHVSSNEIYHGYVFSIGTLEFN